MSDTLIIIPTYISKREHAVVLDKCVKSIRETTNTEILLVDDCSPSEDQRELLFSFFENNYENISAIVKEENEGFSATVNHGLKKAIFEERDALLLNADIEFTNNVWLDNLEDTDADIVGALLLYPNDIIQHAGIYFSSFSRNFDHRFKGAPSNCPQAHIPCECPVTGALQFIRKECLNDVGLYDENFRLGYEDVDFMIRAITGGYKSLYNPKVTAYHHESLMRGNDPSDQHVQWQKESYMTLVKKYGGVEFYSVAPSYMEQYELPKS